MIVERAELFLVPLPLREPFGTSGGAAHERPVILVALHCGDAVGWGECVAGPTPGYGAETTESAWQALANSVLPAVVGRDHPSVADVDGAAAGIRGHTMARASVEMASWDLTAKLRGVPLWESLGGVRREVPAGIVLGFQPDVDTLLAKVGAALDEGYRRIKIKIEPERDLTPLRAVRAHFPDAPLSADANGAYGADDFRRLRELDALGLVMLEQPLPADDLLGHARLQAQLETPICLDESIDSPFALRTALEMGSCRIVNLKPGCVGGLEAAREIHDVCREVDVPLWCGGMLESGVGRAHNVALATLPGFTLPGDLSPSARYWQQDLVEPEWRMVRGALTPPTGPGIGVEPVRARIERLATRRHVVE